jgi:hypothetical protein
MLEDARDCLGLGDFANHTKLPPQLGHTLISISNTRLSRAIQVIGAQGGLVVVSLCAVLARADCLVTMR